MKTLTTIIVLALLSGCASTTVEFMVGTKVHEGGFQGTGPVATGRLRYTINEEAFCEYEHVSFMLRPSQSEDTLNQVGCGVRFGGELQ